VKRWVVAGALALAGCGGDEPTTPASVVPAGAAVYASFDADARALAMPAALARARPQELQPWIGERAAVFALADVPDRAALVFDVADEDGAREFARGAAAGGRFITELVDGHLVVAESEELIAAAQAAAEDDASLDAAAEDGTAAYVHSRDTRMLSGLLPRLGLDRYTEKLVIGTVPASAEVTARLWERRGATVLEVEGAGEAHPPGPELADLPASTWFAVADGDLGTLATSAAMVETVAFGQIESALGVDLENDVLPHLGEGSFYVEDATANDTVGRALVEARDQAALRRAASALVLAQRRRPGAHVEFLRAGETALIRLSPADRPPVERLGEFMVTVPKGRLIVEFGTTGGVSQKLEDAEWFRAAERHLGAPPRLYADLIRLRQDLPGADLLGDAAVLAASESERGGRRVQRFVLLTP
jgi:hypothetical protein